MASPFSEIIYLLSKAMYDRAKTPSLSHSVCDPNDTPAAGDGATQHLTENKVLRDGAVPKCCSHTDWPNILLRLTIISQFPIPFFAMLRNMEFEAANL